MTTYVYFIERKIRLEVHEYKIASFLIATLNKIDSNQLPNERTDKVIR